MQLSRTIGFRIALSFGLLLIAIVVNTILSNRILDNIRESQEEIRLNLNPSLNSLTELRGSLHHSQDILMVLKPGAGLSQSALISQVNMIIQDELPDLQRQLKELSSGWRRNNRDNYNRLHTYLSDSLYGKVSTYTSEFLPVLSDSASMDIRLPEIIWAYHQADQQISQLIDNFEQQASSATQKAGDKYNSGKTTLLVIGISISVSALIIAFFLFYSLVRQIKRYRGIIASMARGVLPVGRIREGKDEMGQIGTALNSLIRGLKDLSDFSEEIGKGNFKSEFKPLSDDDILGNSLIRLREDLKGAAVEDVKRKRDDERRNWSNQGIARFSDILREHSGDLQKLSDHMIAGLVKYLGARVGGIFLITENDKEEEVIELTASYAYDRKKHLQKTIMKGEGLVGRCVQEGKTIFLTEIPDDYISIKSGLGQDDPKSLIIVPMKLNEKVTGVIEIASLDVFQNFQIEFIERIGASMASSIATFHSGEK
jgi:hypothetical protein